MLLLVVSLLEQGVVLVLDLRALIHDLVVVALQLLCLLLELLFTLFELWQVLTLNRLDPCVVLFFNCLHLFVIALDHFFVVFVQLVQLAIHLVKETVQFLELLVN